MHAMTERGRVLVVEDDVGMREMLEQGLTRRGFAIRTAADAQQACELLRNDEQDAVLTDLRLGAIDGIQLVQMLHAIQPGLPVLLMTAFGSLDTAIAAIRAGAYDFVPKPLALDVVTLALDRAVQFRNVSRELVRLRDAVSASETAHELVGESAAMQQVVELVRRVASTDVTVLVTGESGTGKELVARALHRQSSRAQGPFLAVNCAALPHTLLESELFGHVRGAFTDARESRVGLFAQASGGTLFLDEIGEVPLAVQAKLLRALETRKIRPVGGASEAAVDVRIVAATNRDLRALIDEQKFREDMYFRLAVMEIDIPPLRVRGHDVLLIAQRELLRRAELAGRAIHGFTPEAAQLLLSYDWPGNVRELQNAMQRAVAMARFDLIAPEDLPERVRATTRAPAGPLELGDELVPLEEVERRYILHVLKALNGQRTQAAKVLRLDRKTLYRKLEMWGLLSYLSKSD
jgi:two-component system response regulator AtoC